MSALSSSAMAGLYKVPERLLVANTLVFLSLLVVMVAADPSSLSSFWHHELPQSAMPHALEKLASPLSPSSTQHLLSQMQSGTLQASDKQFCSSAMIFCSDKALVPVRGPQPRVCIPPFFNYEYGVLPCRHGAAEVSAVQSSGIFFTQNELVQGKAILLPDTSNDLKGLRFLPAPLADALPQLDEAHFPELAKFYGVKTGSDMELDMKNTLAHCSVKSEHEVRGCELSGEGMVKFVVSTIGQDAVAYTPTSATSQKQEAMVMVMQISMLGREGGKVASCHDMRFPSMLFSCHMTQTAQVLDVTVRLADGQVAQQLAVCHMDTSYWNPTHIAFEALNVKPGSSAVCHWFPQNSFVFVEEGPGM